MTSEKMLSRRRFLSESARGAAMLGAGTLISGCSSLKTCPAGGQRIGHSFRLGLDTFSVHRSLTAKDPQNRRDLWYLLDRLDEFHLTGLQIDPSHFPGDRKTGELGTDLHKRLRGYVDKKGYYFEFGMGGWDVPRMKLRIRQTADFGGKALRTFLGGELTPQKDLENYMKWSTAAMQEAGEEAAKHDVYIAIENHGDFTSTQMKQYLDGIGHPRVGVCLDTANSLFRHEDPIECAKRLVPYARSMHLKDWVLGWLPNGHPDWHERVIGEGTVPLLEILRIVARVRPDLYIAMENPVREGDDETETVTREWRHLKASAAAANRLLKQV